MRNLRSGYNRENRYNRVNTITAKEAIEKNVLYSREEEIDKIADNNENKR